MPPTSPPPSPSSRPEPSPVSRLPGAGEISAREASASRSGSGALRWLPWVLLALVLLGGGVLFQQQVTLRQELEVRIGGLERELATSRALVRAYEGRVAEIREGLATARDQLARLEALAAERPVPETDPAGAPAPEASPPRQPAPEASPARRPALEASPAR